jgi:hypothetical protein
LKKGDLDLLKKNLPKGINGLSVGGDGPKGARNVKNAQQALSALKYSNSGTDAFLGSFIGAAAGTLFGTLLSGGGVLGYPPGGGGFYPNGGYLPPEVPTLFYPCVGNNYIYNDDAYPYGPGVALAITGPPDGGGGGGGDVQVAGGGSAGYDEVGGLAFDAAPWQTTRYVRLGNATAQPVTVNVRYLVEDDANRTYWLPSRPDDPNGDWATFELQPGETADVMDGDWQVNAREVCIWARSDTSEWDQFRDRSLNLVPEQQYQSDAPEVFNYTVR